MMESEAISIMSRTIYIYIIGSTVYFNILAPLQ